MQHSGPHNSTLTTRCHSSLEEVRGVLVRVDTYLQTTRAPSEWREDLNIILAEVLSNIVRHGYAHDKGWIELEIRINCEELCCRISDKGRAFNPNIMGHSAPEPVLLREGGYGWFLIRSLARALRYQRKKGVNCLTFWVPVGADHPVAEPAN